MNRAAMRSILFVAAHKASAVQLSADWCERIQRNRNWRNDRGSSCWRQPAWALMGGRGKLDI